MRTFALTLLVLVPACGNDSGNDAGKAAELASKLVACTNDQQNLKDQIASLKAQLARAEAAANPSVKLDPVDLKATAGVNPVGMRHMEGNVSPDLVIRVVRQNSGGLRACYEHALKRKPDLQYVAAVTAHFSVRNSGSAGDVKFTPHTDAEMERCMASSMEKWHFPTFQGDPVAFEQPVNLVAK